MPISVTCPNCGMRGRVPDGFQGKAKCRTCRSRFGIEVKVTTTPAASPEPAGPEPTPDARPVRRSVPGLKYMLLGLLSVPVLWIVYLYFRPNYIRSAYQARESGNYAEAERQYRLALANETEEDPIDVAREGLAITLQKMDRHREAIPLLEECVEYKRRQFVAEGPKGGSHVVYAGVLEELALSEVALGRWSDADLHLETALRLKEEGLGTLVGVPDYLVRSRLYRSRKLYDQADGFVIRAMDNLINSIGTDNIAFAMCLEERAVLYREWKPDDWHPKEWEESARAIRSKFANAHPKDRTGS